MVSEALMALPKVAVPPLMGPAAPCQLLGVLHVPPAGLAQLAELVKDGRAVTLRTSLPELLERLRV